MACLGQVLGGATLAIDTLIRSPPRIPSEMVRGECTAWEIDHQAFHYDALFGTAELPVAQTGCIKEDRGCTGAVQGQSAVTNMGLAGGS
jgi:hypothetical protein